jgi:hypothetical protein
MMRELRGTTFDPVVLDAFLAIEAEILHIAACFRDEEENETHAQPAEASTHAGPGLLTAALQTAARVSKRVLSPLRPRGP